MKQRGFTVIELLVVIVFFAVVGTVFWLQWNNLETSNRDDKRRIAINAMYYNLEDVFYAKNQYYPETLTKNNLGGIDASLFTDPDGKKIGETGSDYSYSPTDCDEQSHCKGYTLKTTLENEADYVKSSRH